MVAIQQTVSSVHLAKHCLYLNPVKELKVKRIPYTQLEADLALAADPEPQKNNQSETLIPYGPVSRTWHPMSQICQISYRIL